MERQSIISPCAQNKGIIFYNGVSLATAPIFRIPNSAFRIIERSKTSINQKLLISFSNSETTIDAVFFPSESVSSAISSPMMWPKNAKLLSGTQ